MPLWNASIRTSRILSGKKNILKILQLCTNARHSFSQTIAIAIITRLFVDSLQSKSTVRFLHTNYPLAFLCQIHCQSPLDRFTFCEQWTKNAMCSSSTRSGLLDWEFPIKVFGQLCRSSPVVQPCEFTMPHQMLQSAAAWQNTHSHSVSRLHLCSLSLDESKLV